METQTLGDNTRFAANIPKYFVYNILRGVQFGLITSTWVIYLQHQHGLSLTQVTLIDVAFWLAATLGELPTGVVADSYGRKASLAIGTAIMGLSIIGWALAPTVTLITAAYVMLAIGATFLSGAEDAFFFETLKIINRAADYTRLVGRISALRLAAVAIGSLASGLLATLDLRLPFLVAGLSLLSMMGIVLTFKEPKSDEEREQKTKISYGAILKQSFAILWTRPSLAYAIFYLTLVPITAMAMETVFLQPQALALGVPLAGVGIVIMAAQLSNMAGSTLSHRAKALLGEVRTLYIFPLLIAASLALLAAFQQLPGLLFAAAISFFTALLRPIIMYRIQNEVPDTIRATVLSMQALLFAFIVAIIEPLLGYLADLGGLSTAYYALAGVLALLMLLLFWKSRPQFP